MNCEQAKTCFDDYLDGELLSGMCAALDSHLEDCTSCRALIAEEQKLRGALRAMPVTPPSHGFARRALREARKQHEGHRQRWFAAGFATALAASLAMWMVLAPVGPLTNQGPGMSETPMMKVALNQTRTINLVFDAPADFENAVFTMELPEQFEVDGYPGQQMLTWQASLAQGRNVLSLPVHAITRGSGELVARISHGDKVKTFRVHLATNGEVNGLLQPLSRRV